MMKRIFSLIALLLSVLLVAACADAPPPAALTAEETIAEATPAKEEATPAPAPEATEEPAAQEGPKSITIAAGRSFWQGPTTNIFIHGSTNVWESLVMLDEAMNPTMNLAESITPSEDGLTWTVKLRGGITFHDGSALDADTVMYNLDRLYRFNPATKAYDPEYAKSGEYGEITGMEKVDETSFTITLVKPIPDFDLRLAYENSAIFAMASFDDARAIQTPYGTGPYQFDNYDESSEILTLTKFAAYRKGEPKLDTVVFRNIMDATARLAALQSGEIDVISDVGGIMPQQAAQVLGDANLTLKEREVSTVHYICMNTQEGKLFSDLSLRKALSLCIDRESVVDDLLLGYGVQAVSVLTDISSDWTVDCEYVYDPEQAKTIKETILGDETPTATILVSSALTGRWPYQNAALMLQAELKAIGIDAQVELVDAATWTQRLKDGEYDISIHPFTVSAGEPNFFFVRNMLTGGSNNVARGYGISDAELDAMIRQVEAEPDKAKRQDLYAQMQRLVRDNEYLLPVWYDVTLYAMNRRVKDFEIDVIFCPDLFAVDVTD